MIRRPPRSTQFRSSAASDVYKRQDLAHTPSIGGSENLDEAVTDENSEDKTQFLKLVKDITSKGFVRSNYKKKLVDLSDIKINLKGKK